MQKKLLITGGAGFIGSNAAARFTGSGWDVTIFDNLSRPGSKSNAAWLEEFTSCDLIRGDVRDAKALSAVCREFQFDAVLHCAGQVAVTSSVVDPRFDFEVNALGTFNVLEAVRAHCPEAILVYTSTNKVYGSMEDLDIVEQDGDYRYRDLSQGVVETRALDFHSPYGCSKGAGDQYVLDYHRIYGLRTVVLRQSCIYGPRQFGMEDQGWVAWFAISAVFGRPVTIFGDGKQTRDVLHVEELINCFATVLSGEKPDIFGQAFNIGGGPENVLSLITLVRLLEEVTGRKLDVGFAPWRPGDQRTFVCNIEKARRVLGWEPQISYQEGICELIDWVRENAALLEQILKSKALGSSVPLQEDSGR